MMLECWLFPQALYFPSTAQVQSLPSLANALKCIVTSDPAAVNIISRRCWQLFAIMPAFDIISSLQQGIHWN
jgi:hypothetical protein